MLSYFNRTRGTTTAILGWHLKSDSQQYLDHAGDETLVQSNVSNTAELAKGVRYFNDL
jgi:hypothetical protein